MSSGPSNPGAANAGGIAAAARHVREATRICVSTGAGMSAESGVSTFRDAGGLWSKFNPAELATPEAFGRDPKRVWAWYRQRRQNLARVEPHAGHCVLSAWEARGLGVTIVTQNVDGLHHRAGSKNVIELHGRLDVVRCCACDYSRQSLDDLGEDPLCPSCSQRLRPGVVWFGEALPDGAFAAAVNAVEDCDALLVIGTSGVVQPAASLVEIATHGGAVAIEINPSPTPLTELCGVSIRAGCRDALTAIDAAMATPNAN